MRADGHDTADARTIYRRSSRSSSVAKPDLRLAVFATKTGWRAKVYPEGSENVEKLRARLEAKAALLSEQYELVL